MLGMLDLTITDASHKLEKWLCWKEHTVKGSNEVEPWQESLLQSPALDLYHPKSATYGFAAVFYMYLKLLVYKTL